jgi:hypothetical protein
MMEREIRIKVDIPDGEEMPDMGIATDSIPAATPLDVPITIVEVSFRDFRAICALFRAIGVLRRERSCNTVSIPAGFLRAFAED